MASIINIYNGEPDESKYLQYNTSFKKVKLKTNAKYFLVEWIASKCQNTTLNPLNPFFCLNIVDFANITSDDKGIILTP